MFTKQFQYNDEDSYGEEDVLATTKVRQMMQEMTDEQREMIQRYLIVNTGFDRYDEMRVQIKTVQKDIMRRKCKGNHGEGQSEEFEALITQLCDTAVQFDHLSFKTQ